MQKTIGLFLTVIGLSSLALASTHTIPEIDPAGAMNALALVGGALLILRAKRKK